MNRQAAKFYSILSLCVLVLIMSSGKCFGSTMQAGDERLKQVYSDLINIQKQMSAVVESVYQDKIENSSTDKNQRVLNIIIQQLNKIKNELEEQSVIDENDKTQEVLLEAYTMMTDLLKYMAQSLEDYSTATTYGEQLQFLRIYFRLEGMVDQLSIDFQYFDSLRN